MVCDFKMRKKKANKRNFVLGRKVRKLHDDSIRSYNCSYDKKFKWGKGDDDGYWKILKGVLLGLMDGQKGQLHIEKYGC